MTTVTSPQAPQVGRIKFKRAYDQGKTAPFTMAWTFFTAGQIIAQVTGTATSITVKVERSDSDPAVAAQPAPADAVGFSGNVSAGIPPNIYLETGMAWWRINVTAVSGGNINVSLTGNGS